jgi:hypothetical protein
MGNQSFTWKGNDYRCTASSKQVTNTLMLGGLEGEFAIQFNTRLYDADDETGDVVDIFNGVYPASGQTLTFNSELYRIRTVQKDPTNTFLSLICENANKGNRVPA